MAKPNPPAVTGAPAVPSRPAAKMSPVAAPGAGKPPSVPFAGRLFRGVDWLAFAVVTLFVLAGYLFTISPEGCRPAANAGRSISSNSVNPTRFDRTAA